VQLPEAFFFRLWFSVSFIARVCVFWLGFYRSKRILVEEEISKIILYPLGWILFSDQCSYFTIFIGVFHDLMKSRWDDGVAMNPWSSQQQIV